jgi:uncharacterized membrane protein YdjX (TVP38/TMEM64 family)
VATLLARARLGPRARLGVLVAALVAALFAFSVADLLTTGEVRGWIEPLGAAGPPVYVLVAAGLGCLLVPGPLLAGVSGLLFGAALGTVVTIAAAVLGAVAALVLGRAIGRPGMAELSGPRLDALSVRLERHGTAAVIAQRLAPGLPDAPFSYLAGLLRVRPHQIALGTLVGSAPRAFSYTALGGSLDDLGSPVALAALAVLGLTTVVGAEVTRRAMRRARAS